jgi:GDP-4-dehydro-6-deoxy-D-mannose reductase
VVDIILGSNGFIGRHLRMVITPNISMDRKEFELTEPKCWDNLFSKYNIRNLYLLAGISHPIDVQLNKELSRKTNVDSVKYLLSIIPDNIRIIYPSSVHVYGVPNYIPIDEHHSLSPISEYGKQKLEVERMLLESDKDVVIARLFNCVSLENPAKNTFLWDWYNQKQPIKVGNINVIRDLVLINDAAMALKLIAKYGQKGEVYNVCSGIGIELKEILINLGIDYYIDKNKYRGNEINKIIGCNKSLLELGWKPKGLLINP